MLHKIKKNNFLCLAIAIFFYLFFFNTQQIFAINIDKNISNISDIKTKQYKVRRGDNLWMIAKEGFRASGLDISSAALKLAEQRLADYGCTAELFKASMTQIPCPDSSFDVVVDVFSSNCLDTSEGERFLEEVSRILKPSGLFFSYFPSKSSDAWMLEQKSNRVDQNTLHGFERKKSHRFWVSCK